MDFAKVFKFIIEKFRQEKIDFAIIGGFALQFSGITRATRDIDLLVLSQDSPKIKDILVNCGYKLIHESEDVLNFISENPQLGRIDFLLAHREYSREMLKRATEKEIFSSKLRIKVISIEDQIGLKVQSSSNDPSRQAQDMADIELLIKNNYPNLDVELLKEYFDLFDRRTELNKIIERLKNVK
ncbi:MAG: nucleotidyltransferase [Candidatus Omnitrophota bacterium]